MYTLEDLAQQILALPPEQRQSRAIWFSTPFRYVGTIEGFGGLPEDIPAILLGDTEVGLPKDHPVINIQLFK